MSNVVVYNVYWLPSGQSGPNQALIDQFTQDLGGPFVGLLAQYGVQNRISFGGSWVDPNAFPNSGNLQDSDIQNAVTAAATANPSWNGPGLSTMYMVYLASGTTLCNSGECTAVDNQTNPPPSFCAYHGAFSQSGSTFVYGAMPFDGDRLASCGIATTGIPGSTGSVGPNGNVANDSEISTASHEIFETLTDPEPQANPAWNDGANPLLPTYLHNEIGDMCAYVYHPDADKGDVTLNGDRYFIQQEWSNATSGCELPGDATLPRVANPGCGSNSLAANDDGSTGQVALPFSMNFFGTTYNSLWVNNNGNVTFDGPLSVYTPFPILSTGRVIIAPYFSDVDTRGQTPVPSGLTTYGTVNFGGRTAFCVSWRNVGYYSRHDEKPDTFQMLLLDRSDQGAGDFDIIFNYDRIQWETGDASGGRNGLGGGSARVGFSNGSTNSLELFNSGVNGALLDYGSAALTAGSHGSSTVGRYIFPIRNGSNGGGGTIQGRVTDSAVPPHAVSGAQVQVCGGFLSIIVCDIAVTNATGNYSVTSLPGGIYEVTVSPPPGSPLFQRSVPAILLPNATLTVDVALDGPQPLPAGTTIGSSYTNPDGTPVLYWQTTTPLTTHGCPGGTATVTVTAENSQTGTQQTVSGSLQENPVGSGTYTGSIPPLYPLHGAGTVRIAVTCPNPANNSVITFSIYIDPSGMVVDSHGQPVAGATVTLYRSDASTGPFEVVASGSAIMSPANRTNPQTTAMAGTFGWDVIAGFYKVRAEKVGCTDPANPAASFVDSPVLTIPPPITNLTLTLQCSGAPLITSAASAGFTVGTTSSFVVTTTGTPAPAITESGSLPSGVTLVDNHNGTATLGGVPGTGSAGVYPITLKASNGVSPDATQAFTLTVNQAATTTSVSASAANVTFGSSVSFTAVVSPTAPNSLTPSGTVAFYLDNQASPVALMPLVAGSATLTTAGLGAGVHVVTAIFGGDANFLGSTSATSSPTTVSCTTTITGSQATLRLTSGSICVTNATFSGSLIVGAGANVDIESSTVHGALSASGSGEIRICGTSTVGSVTVSGAQGLVLLGDAGDDACLPDTVGGGLILQRNAHGLEAIGNRVAGAVVNIGSAGGGAFPEDAAPEVEGNHS